MSEQITPDEAIEECLKVGAQGISLGLAKCLQSERNDLRAQLEEAKWKIKNYEPINTYNGLDIDQWKARAENAESMLNEYLLLRECDGKAILATHLALKEAEAKVAAMGKVVEAAKHFTGLLVDFGSWETNPEIGLAFNKLREALAQGNGSK